jgi:hypothetical protein
MRGKGDDRDERDGGRAARGARLASALRANLQRRKAQARARTAPGRPGAPHDSAGIPADKASEGEPIPARADRGPVGGRADEDR